jgi:hypothetical protein
VSQITLADLASLYVKPGGSGTEFLCVAALPKRQNGAINMKSTRKIEQDTRAEPEVQDNRQIRQISKEELKEIAGFCGDMGGVVVIRF